MYETIMVPTDCSGFDREAIRVALRIARQNKASVRLVRVRTTGAYFGTAISPDCVDLSMPALMVEGDTALTELTALAAECRNTADVDVGFALENGPITDALEGYARRNRVDLIVISSHGRGGISRLSLGSVTDSLIRHTTIPVLVVKPSASYLNPQVTDTFRRIVVPLDGSTLAEQILAPIVTLAKLEDAEITLLTVLEPQDAGEIDSAHSSFGLNNAITASQAYLFRVAERLRGIGVAVVCDVVIGERVAEEIVAYAGRERADLISIATHGRGGLSRILRGSVADAVTRSARTCILALHPVMAASPPLEEESPLRWQVVAGV